MSEDTPPDVERIDPYYGEGEDTDQTSLAAKIPLLGWYLRTTRGLGKSRAFFLPFGFMALAALAFFLGFARLERLCDLLLLGIHRAFSALGAVTSPKLDDLLDLSARRSAAPVLAAAWATLAALRLALGAIPADKGDSDIGYVVPGSGILARAWGAIGKRIYQLKRAVVFLAGYLRDVNIEKIHLPATILMLVAIAGVSLSQAAENLLFELPARLPAVGSGWIPTASVLIAALCVLVLGIPMLTNSLLRAHQRSVERRKKKAKLVRRLLGGLAGLIFMFAPLAWMTIGLIGGTGE